jgi:hypothetical protein
MASVFRELGLGRSHIWRAGGVPVIAIPVSVLILFAAAISLIIGANLVLYAMIGEVNRKLPENQQIGYLGFYPSKAFRITREYRRFYPDGHLNTLRVIFNVLGFILGVCAAARLSHFWR